MSKVSVIVPIYNTQKYLSRCLDSLINQTLDDIEILVVDDGSTDGSSRIVDQYALKSRKIKVFHQKNGGVSKARNLGLLNATGEYIGFVDSDDYIQPSMYSTMLYYAESENADIVQCGIVYSADNSANPDNSIRSNKVDNLVGAEELVKGLLDGKIINSVCSKLFSRKVVSGIGFSEDLVFAEDFEFTSKCLLFAEKVSILKQPLYIYTSNRADSQTHNKINPSQLMWFRVYDMMAENFERRGLRTELLHKKELSESLRSLDSIIGHKNIPEDFQEAILHRLKKNKGMILGNPYLSKSEVFRCFIASFAPRSYCFCVFVAKVLMGRLVNG